MTEEEPGRGRNSAPSRDRLLHAASELFADRGYDRTTARDIGERAGADPALIARYFGGKSQLYVAVLRSERERGPFLPMTSSDRLSRMLDRIVRSGPGPIYEAVIRPYDDTDAQMVSLEELRRRGITPLSEHLAARGEEQPELLAEFLFAVFIGVILSRHAGTMPHLANTTKEELFSLLQSVIPMDQMDDSEEHRAPEQNQRG